MNDSVIDLDARLPSKWTLAPSPRGPIDVQVFAPTLRELRDRARERYGKAYAANFLTGRVLVSMIKADALDMLAGHYGEVDGYAFAVAVQSLIVHLTVDTEG